MLAVGLPAIELTVNVPVCRPARVVGENTTAKLQPASTASGVVVGQVLVPIEEAGKNRWQSRGSLLPGSSCNSSDIL